MTELQDGPYAASQIARGLKGWMPVAYKPPVMLEIPLNTPLKIRQKSYPVICIPGPEVIKREISLKLEIKPNDWLFVDTCPQAANQRALFCV